MMRLWAISIYFGLLAGCAGNPPAPVIDRMPQISPKQPSVKPEDKPTSDWRPDSYIVKKGDNLLRIGLEYGYDYKEIAAVNNIPPPYVIKVGQKLDFSPLKTKTNGIEGAKSSDGVVVTPIKTESGATEIKSAQEAKPITPPVFSQPKATREPYSQEAMNRPSTTKSAETKPSDPTTPAPVASGDVTKSSGDEALTWSWPTQGKVVANFAEGVNKGIDIAGSTGQTIKAASSGKVIYSGSDLRGYGKLVIIKHNKTYLSVYAHNSKILVKEGQIVAEGQKIAEMGNTDTNATKLHFEIRRQGKSVDPAPYLSQN